MFIRRSQPQRRVQQSSIKKMRQAIVPWIGIRAFLLLIVLGTFLQESSSFLSTSRKSMRDNRAKFRPPEDAPNILAAVSDPVIVNGNANGAGVAPEATDEQVKPKTTEDESIQSDSAKAENQRKTLLDKNDKEDDDTKSIFENLAIRAAICLFESELQQDLASTKAVKSSTTNWINDATVATLQNTFNRVKLKVT